MESAPSELNRRPMQTHSLPQCGDGVGLAFIKYLRHDYYVLEED